MIDELSERILASRLMVVLLIAVNFTGFLFGIYYYAPQLEETPWFLWLLVADCPLQVLLFAAVLAWKPLPPTLRFLNAVGLAKYGLWTVLVILLHVDFFFSANPLLYGILLPLHLGMALESLILLRLLETTPRSTLLVTFFFLLNDVSDYVYGTLPRIPDTHVPLLAAESILASLLLPAVIYFLCRRKHSF